MSDREDDEPFDDELPLSELFAKGAAIYSKVENDEDVSENNIRRGIEIMRACLSQIYSKGIFSPNETKDDISTASLKYLLPHSYLGTLYMKRYHKKEDGTPDHEERLQTLRQARMHVNAFLSMCQKKELMHKEDLKLYERDKGGGTTAHDKRNEKIAAFKRDKEVKEKMRLLEERKKAMGKSKSGADEAEGEEAGDLEDVEREATLAVVEMGVRNAMSSASAIEEESNMLTEVLKNGLDKRPLPKAMNPRDVVQAGMAEIAEISLAQAMGHDKEYIKSRIFQPGHALPTMSLEEFGMLEEQRMIENTKKEQESATRKQQEEEDDPEKDSDAARNKAEMWDRYREDNPRGSGNKMK